MRGVVPLALQECTAVPICAVLCRFVPCASLRVSPDLQCLCFEDVSECAVCGERDPSEVAHSPQFLTMHCSVSFMSK